jgi:hypothetical protein
MEHVKLYIYSFFIFVYLILWGPPIGQVFPQLSAPQKISDRQAVDGCEKMNLVIYGKLYVCKCHI